MPKVVWAVALASAVLALAGCVRPEPRLAAAPPPATAWPERAAYEQEARTVLADLDAALATFEQYVQYRQGPAAGGGGATGGSAATGGRAAAGGGSAAVGGSATGGGCDPPQPEAWQRASLAVATLSARAAGLERAVDQSQPDPDLWRERRALAEVAHRLAGALDATRAARTEIDLIAADGNGGRAVEPLARARAAWTGAARLLEGASAPTVACA